MDEETYINQEVQRRTARQTQQLHGEITELRDTVRELANVVVKQNADISQLTAQPLYYGIVLKIQVEPDVNNFHVGDEVLVIDRDSPHYNKGGKLCAGMTVRSSTATRTARPRCSSNFSTRPRPPRNSPSA